MKKAFTLIELLIVVAIIAILAAIAVPNFLEAQTRAKVSRAKADMRSLATGLESYRVDANSYPSGNQNGVSRRLTTDPATEQYMVLEKLSTPIAYMTAGLLPDPFRSTKRSGTPNPSTGDSTPADFTGVELAQEGDFKYAATDVTGTGVLALTGTPAGSAKGFWILWSAGPQTIKCQVAGTGLLNSAVTDAAVLSWIYDPTNGTVSRGNVFRVGGTTGGSTDGVATFFRNVTTSQR